jgi:hypothetical protein
VFSHGCPKRSVTKEDTEMLDRVLETPVQIDHFDMIFICEWKKHQLAVGKIVGRLQH